MVAHPGITEPRPTMLYFGEQTGSDVFPLVLAVHNRTLECKARLRYMKVELQAESIMQIDHRGRLKGGRFES